MRSTSVSAVKFLKNKKTFIIFRHNRRYSTVASLIIAAGQYLLASVVTQDSICWAMCFSPSLVGQCLGVLSVGCLPFCVGCLLVVLMPVCDPTTYYFGLTM